MSLSQLGYSESEERSHVSLSGDRLEIKVLIIHSVQLPSNRLPLAELVCWLRRSKDEKMMSQTGRACGDWAKLHDMPNRMGFYYLRTETMICFKAGTGNLKKYAVQIFSEWLPQCPVSFFSAYKNNAFIVIIFPFWYRLFFFFKSSVSSRADCFKLLLRNCIAAAQPTWYA